VLALLVGERDLARESGAPKPLFLLDDVMSELDPDRRRRLMELLAGEGGQTVITAADQGLFSEEELEHAAIFQVTDGRVSEVRAGFHV
jgi:DNA replication and repair protein RecF